MIQRNKKRLQDPLHQKQISLPSYPNLVNEDNKITIERIHRKPRSKPEREIESVGGYQ